MDYESLTSEQKDKLSSCKTPEDVLALAREEGYELSDEELEAIAGGSIWDSDYYKKCPECGSTNIRRRGQQIAVPDYLCVDCGTEWG